MRGLSPRLKLRFLQLYPRFFWMELWPRLIHAAIGRLSSTFFGQSLRFFFFFLRHILNPITLWRARSPSIFSLTLHLSDLKPSPSLSISDQKPSPRPSSLISNFASPPISDQKPSPHPPSPISTFASPSISNPKPSPHSPSPISTFASLPHPQTKNRFINLLIATTEAHALSYYTRFIILLTHFEAKRISAEAANLRYHSILSLFFLIFNFFFTMIFAIWFVFKTYGLRYVVCGVYDFE